MKKTKFTGIILLFIIFCTLSFPVSAWELNGDIITINTNGAEKINEIIIEGSVSIIDENMEFAGDYACYNRESEDLSMEGNIKLINNEYNLTGDSLQGNLETQNFIVSGRAQFSGPDVLLNSETINYDNKDGIITMRGNPSFNYKNMTASADKITYYKKDEKALLEGNVRGKRDGQEFVSSNLSVNMAEEQIKLSGKARLIFSDGGDN